MKYFTLPSLPATYTSLPFRSHDLKNPKIQLPDYIDFAKASSTGEVLYLTTRYTKLSTFDMSLRNVIGSTLGRYVLTK